MYLIGCVSTGSTVSEGGEPLMIIPITIQGVAGSFTRAAFFTGGSGVIAISM